jgi:hypothetical protein
MLQLADLVSCLNRTLARMLIIVLSVGFDVVKPRLGSTLHKVVGVGFVYFLLCAIEGVMRVSKVGILSLSSTDANWTLLVGYTVAVSAILIREPDSLWVVLSVDCYRDLLVARTPVDPILFVVQLLCAVFDKIARIPYFF